MWPATFNLNFWTVERSSLLLGWWGSFFFASIFDLVEWRKFSWECPCVLAIWDKIPLGMCGADEIFSCKEKLILEEISLLGWGEDTHLMNLNWFFTMQKRLTCHLALIRWHWRAAMSFRCWCGRGFKHDAWLTSYLYMMRAHFFFCVFYNAFSIKILHDV